MSYEHHLIQMEGILVEITEASVVIDLKGRLGQLKIPLRMLITDYPLEVGQEICFQMSFPEVKSSVVNEHYRRNINRRSEKETKHDSNL